MIVVDAIFGFLFTRFMAGRKAGKQGRLRSVRFRVKDKYTVHLHHWFLCGIALAGMQLIDISSTFLHGLVYGSIAQGLLYRDFYKFIYMNKESGKPASMDVSTNEEFIFAKIQIEDTSAFAKASSVKSS